MIINGFRKVLNNYNKTHKHLSLRAVGRITGASTYSITALYDGKANGIKFDVLNKLIKFFKVPVTDLINYQSGAITFYLVNGNKFLRYYEDSRPFKVLNPKQKTLAIKHFNKSLILKSKLGNLVITVKGIHHHKYDADITNMFSSIDSVLLKPLEYADIEPSNDITKANHFIGVQIKTSFIGIKNSHFKNIFNKLPNKFKNYIWTRALLHSGLLKSNEKSYDYDFINDNYVHDVDVSGGLPSVKPVKLVQWQHKYKYKNKNSYNLKAKSGNYKINLHDYTTNNFKD